MVWDRDHRVRFYFDYISSNAYMAWQVIPGLAERYGVALEPIPVLFAGLLKAYGGLGPAEVPAKALWMWKNNMRKAAILDVPLNPPAFHPFNPLLSLRVSGTDVSDDERNRMIEALFRAVWVDGRHVSETEVVKEILDDTGLDGSRLVEEAQSQEAKDRLKEQTDRAIADGVFGVPSMVVGDELFWGYDDIPYLERCLAGKDPLDPAAVPSAETAPRPSAVRKESRRDNS